MNIYILDTSAILTFIENEDGITEVENIILGTINQEYKTYISIISVIELFYISFREQGQETALERLQLLQDLPIIQEPVTDEYISVIGKIKALNSLSFADCCIAGLTKKMSGILIHKDPEFEQLKDIQQIKLPYK